MALQSKIMEVEQGLKNATAILEARTPDGIRTMDIGGNWRLSEPVPSWKTLLGGRTDGTIRIVPVELGKWDSSLVLFLAHCRGCCERSNFKFDAGALPENLQLLLRQVSTNGGCKTIAKPQHQLRLEFQLATAKNFMGLVGGIVSFVGECTLGLVNAAKDPMKFRGMDFLVEMQRCWASSFLIVSLVSFMVGVILAFQAAIQLRQYGAAIFVADLVGLSVVREMGPMMAAVVVAGSTGAGFAAQLGNMRADEEIDALETLGISSVDFLVLPRLLAASVMMPFLALYANVLGILGGMFVSASMLQIPAASYWIETQNRVGRLDTASGLIKSVFFGLLVGVSGCLWGMKCDRNAAGVGTATSSAVVTGILLIVLADALFAFIFNVLGI